MPRARDRCTADTHQRERVVSCRRFSGNRNAALKSAHTLRKLIAEARVTRLRKRAPRAEGNGPADKARSKGRVIARSGPGSPPPSLFLPPVPPRPAGPHFHGAELPLFRYSRSSVGLTEESPRPRAERKRATRDGLFALIELLCKVAINFSIR